jgi:hypothetical protein
MRAAVGAAALLALSAGVPIVGISAAAGQDPARVSSAERRGEAFARRFVQAMARGDRGAIGSMIRYRATVLAGGFTIPLSDPSSVRDMYDAVFTPELRCLVERKPVRADAAGVALADGRVRLEDVNGDLKITRISVPPATGAAPPPPSPPRRVAMRWGKGQAQYSGRLYSDGVDSYILRAAKGDRLEARIERFPGRNAFVRVVQLSSNRRLERPQAPTPRTWANTIPETGEYRVDVVRQAPYCEPPFTYLLTINVR